MPIAKSGQRRLGPPGQALNSLKCATKAASSEQAQIGGAKFRAETGLPSPGANRATMRVPPHSIPKIGGGTLPWPCVMRLCLFEVFSVDMKYTINRGLCHDFLLISTYNLLAKC